MSWDMNFWIIFVTRVSSVFQKFFDRHASEKLGSRVERRSARLSLWMSVACRVSSVERHASVSRVERFFSIVNECRAPLDTPARHASHCEQSFIIKGFIKKYYYLLDYIYFALLINTSIFYLHF